MAVVFHGSLRGSVELCWILLTTFACMCMVACNGDSGPTAEQEAEWAKEAEASAMQKRASIEQALKWSKEANSPRGFTVAKTKPAKRPVKVDPFLARFSDETQKFREDPAAANFAELEKLFEESRIDGQTDGTTATPATSWAYSALGFVPQPSEKRYVEHIAKFERWQQAHPDSTTPLIAKAGAYLNWAFFARGGDTVDTVPEEAWRPFNERNREAKQLLVEAEKRGAADAHLYKALIAMGKADGTERETVAEWFEKGKKLDPKCLPLYAVMTEYLLPRWHGLPGEIREFADRMAEEMPGELGQTAYLNIAMTQAFYEPDVVMRGDFDLDVLHAGAQVVADRWPDAAVMNEFCAHIAWLKQDLPLAKKTQYAIQEDYTAGWWRFDNLQTANFEHFCNSEAPPAPCDRLIWNPTYTTGVRFLTSGDQLATYSLSAAPLKIWDIETGVQVAAVALPLHNIGSLDRHPMKDRFVVALKVLEPAVESAMIIDLESGDEPLTLYDAGLGRFYNVIYSPDGSRIAGVHGGRQLKQMLSLWNANTGELERRVEMSSARRDPAFSPDGKQLSFSSPVIYDIESDKWREFAQPMNRPNSIDLTKWGGFVSQDVVVALLRRGTKPNPVLALWNSSSQKADDLLEFDSQVHSIKISKSRRLLVALKASKLQGRQDVQVIDLQERKPRGTFPNVSGGVEDIDFSPDESWIALACRDGGARLFRLPESGEAKR